MKKIKNKNIFLYYLANYICLNHKSLIFIFIKNNCLIRYIKVKKLNKNFCLLTLAEHIDTKQLDNFLVSVCNFIYKKIIFSGKGFKIRKNRYSINFLFNKSHNISLVIKKTKILKLTKNSLAFVSKKILKVARFTKIFSINKFTKKGIRVSNQVVLIRKK